MASFHEVYPGVFIGPEYCTYTDQPKNDDWKQLYGKHNVRRIVRCLVEYKKAPSADVTLLHIPIKDDESEQILPHFHRVAAFIQEGLDGGCGVYVHCAAGVSRSGSMVTAFTMLTQKCCVATALRAVTAKRRAIEPNVGFLSQLLQLEEMEWPNVAAAQSQSQQPKQQASSSAPATQEGGDDGDEVSADASKDIPPHVPSVNLNDYLLSGVSKAFGGTGRNTIGLWIAKLLAKEGHRDYPPWLLEAGEYISEKRPDKEGALVYEARLKQYCARLAELEKESETALVPQCSDPNLGEPLLPKQDYDEFDPDDESTFPDKQKAKEFRAMRRKIRLALVHGADAMPKAQLFTLLFEIRMGK